MHIQRTVVHFNKVVGVLPIYLCTSCAYNMSTRQDMLRGLQQASVANRVIDELLWSSSTNMPEELAKCVLFVYSSRSNYFRALESIATS